MMCSARKRKSFEADNSDDDFDYTVQKRLRANYKQSGVKPNASPNEKHQGGNSRISKHPHKNRVLSSESSKTRDISIPYSTESITSATIDHMTFVESDSTDSIVTDNNLSSNQIIADILDDHSNNELCDVKPQALMNISHNDMSCDVKPQALTNMSQSPIEVSSPKKQSSLLEFFKVERNGTVLTKETSTSKNNSKSTNFKMYQSGSSGQMMFSKHNEPKNASSFYNNANRDCPFYKKIPGTCTVDSGYIPPKVYSICLQVCTIVLCTVMRAVR